MLCDHHHHGGLIFGLTSKDISLIIKILKSYPAIEEAIIFGSRAMGCEKPGSDIDLALKGVDQNLALTVSAELNENTPLPYFFDVLAYSCLDHAALISHIDTHGKILYTRNLG